MSSHRPRPQPRPPSVHAEAGSGRYAVLLASMALIVVLSGIGASKGVRFGPIITDGGFWLFPLAYVIGDVITEVYGPVAARRAIITGFALNAFAALAYQIVIVLPGFGDAYAQTRQTALQFTLGPVWQIVLGSLLGFLGGQSTNSLIMWWGKRRSGEQRLIARLAGSTGLGELIDTLIFCSIAASVIGVTSVRQWANYTVVGFAYKVAVQYLLMPLTAVCIGWLKNHEPTYHQALVEIFQEGRVSTR